MLESLKTSSDQRQVTAVVLPEVGEVMLEIYRPGESKNLEYTRNLQRPDWEPLHVTLL